MKTLSDAYKKGFLSIYAFTILPIVLLFVSTYLQSVKYQIEINLRDTSLHYVELNTILTVKEELLRYEEKNKTYTYNGYEVEVLYEDISCYIKIYSESQLLLHSCLEWDDIDNCVVSYSYLEI